MFELINVLEKYMECAWCLFCDENCDANGDQGCTFWDGCNPIEDINV